MAWCLQVVKKGNGKAGNRQERKEPMKTEKIKKEKKVYIFFGSAKKEPHSTTTTATIATASPSFASPFFIVHFHSFTRNETKINTQTQLDFALILGWPFFALCVFCLEDLIKKEYILYNFIFSINA